LLPILLVVLQIAGCQTMPVDRQKPDAAVATHLMFQEGNAREAMALYASVFPGFHVDRIETYAAGEPGAAGTVKRADANLYGHRLIVIDSPVRHAFTFTPSVSLFVDFASAGELDSAFARLVDGGKIFMPLDDYGFSRRFGWCADRFGVSWQLNLPNGPAAPTTAPAK
jgi:predicted 3-demethylubiquinone-9 3-methyltransferase (glyoxalase superfamily)